MSDSDVPDYKELFEQEKRRRQEEETLRKHEEALRKQAEDSGRRERERNRKTTFEELLRSIPIPTGKYCPTRLELWEDCPALHQEVYSSVCRYLQSENEEVPRLFPSLIEIEGLANRFVSRPISSEQELELYQRIAVEDHVRDIITELCKIPAAREEFGLGDGIFFDNHTNSLNRVDSIGAAVSQSSSIHHPRPDRFFMHRVDSETTVPLTSGESKPPHKLSMATIRLGLRPMDLWEHMVRSRKMPTDPTERLKYNAQRLVCSAMVQQYHVMIQTGQAVGYLTNGFCDIALWIPHDDPATLCYRLCDPTREIGGADLNILEPKTAIARRLCLCLVSCRHSIRSQDWRNAARKRLPLWQTSFDQIRSEIPKDDLTYDILHSDGTEPDHGDVCIRDLKKLARRRLLDIAQTLQTRQDLTRIQQHQGESEALAKSNPLHPRNQHPVNGATRVILAAMEGGILDDKCPNVKHHRQGLDDSKHPIDADRLVHLLKKQLDENLDRNCTPFGHYGQAGAPFKVTCATYGYTVVGKGTTSDWWAEVAREATFYQILRKAQASATPVFLGIVDLAEIYFLHDREEIREIRHMLIMGWGGENPKQTEMYSEVLWQQIMRLSREIESLGVIH
ncbi:hypothetical protein MGU_11007 [Metarhizium guizhouense ARSEF 977]|uniref:Protein kinase-like domain protein n=1 Tax=Metarhizium guizhouense (strain ARSEF 977) TaxID=1276136 RepID=A0A0B4HQD9_METGA|nr:hypothetical protein MGU_11007 [Metarhizium guizhouense ARSEF 977]